MEQQSSFQKQDLFYEDEINLLAYLRVMLKRKYFILALFLAAVIVVGIFSFFWPKNYRIETVLEIGSTGKIPETIEKIESDIYSPVFGIKASNPKNTNFIRIELISAEPEQAKKELASLNELILIEDSEKIEAHKNLLEKEIKALQEKIDFLLKKNQETAILQLELNSLQRQKELFQSARVIKEPFYSEKPVSPKPGLNMAIAGLLGLFVGIFLVFFKEGWEKTK